MTIKYEPVFGDQSLFKDGFCPDAIAVIAVQGNTNHTFHAENLGIIDDYLTGDGTFVLAMRRIIKEPNRWTWEDKKAGRLPPVGAEVECGDGNRYEFIGITKHKDQWALRETDGVIFYIHKDSIYPIETPEEKAQREQEEFVASFNSEKYSNPTLYREGLRDAYRKLKVPTND